MSTLSCSDGFYSSRSTSNWLKEADSLHAESGDTSVAKEGSDLLPVVLNFKNAVEESAELTMLFHQMFQEVPEFHSDATAVNPAPPFNDYLQMFRALNAILTRAPEFNESALVGCPLNAILVWAMATPSGCAAFLNDTVNFHLKQILDHWAQFLESSESCCVLREDPERGWFGERAMRMMPGFAEQFKCDPTKPHYGFKSWDHFFTREFRDGVRPVAAPDDDRVIVNACESAPYNIQRDVQFQDHFWIKSQNYSLRHMLGNDPQASAFVGGTVYQAFLSATSYHRWHSPVNGRIVKAFVKPGTYFSQALVMGWDEAGPNNSQAYIAEVATRAIIFIQADNPDIGLMVFLGVGMGEVSSCDITVEVGQQVKKGQQIGMFHYGGSTHCLIFGPHVKIEFDLRGQIPSMEATNLPVNSLLATVQ